MIKVDLITGFLGSGKTTFIKEYAKYLMSQGLKIGILENDYGAVNVDMMLLGELRGEQCELEMIAGGCDYDCHKRRFKTKLISMAMMGYQRILIEPSGIYDVDEFFDVLYDEPLDNWYEIGNVITVVDASLEEEMTAESEYLLACQTAKAGKIILSRVNGANSEDILKTINHLNKALTDCKANRRFAGSIDEDGTVILDDCIVSKDFQEISFEEWSLISKCGYKNVDHVKHPVSEENDYQSLYFMNKKMSVEKLKEVIEDLLSQTCYGHVFRIKGFMMVDSDEWIEINANQKGISLKQVTVGQEVVIVIGEDLQEEKINQLFV